MSNKRPNNDALLSKHVLTNLRKSPYPGIICSIQIVATDEGESDPVTSLPCDTAFPGLTISGLDEVGLLWDNLAH